MILHHSSHTTHHTPLFSHHSSHTTLFTPLILHHSSHTTHHTPLITHHSSYTTITHHSSHTAHLTLLITHHSSHTTHHTPLITHHSSHTTLHTPLVTHHSSHPLLSSSIFPSCFLISLYCSLIVLTSLTYGVIRSFFCFAYPFHPSDKTNRFPEFTPAFPGLPRPLRVNTGLRSRSGGRRWFGGAEPRPRSSAPFAAERRAS